MTEIFNQKYNDYLDKFNQYLLSSLNKLGANSPNLITEAMKYAVEGGGKRVRPVLCIATADVLGLTFDDVKELALAIELIHSYSLVHDDLPAMDNDDYRRGKQSTHKKFGEANGILAGDALLNYAFEILLSKQDISSGYFNACKLIAEYAGFSGMILGQVLDLKNEKNPNVDQKILYDIIENKTAKLIMAPVLSASKIAENKHFDELKEFSYNLGVLFQIIDDVMDEVGSLSLIGKTPHKDKEADKLTAVKIFGLEGAKRQAKIHYEKCVQALKNVENSEFLVAFANKIFKRNK